LFFCKLFFFPIRKRPPSVFGVVGLPFLSPQSARTRFGLSELQLFDPRDAAGGPRTLCHPAASNAGERWNTDHCPYDDGPVKVYAP
jgi:hypothetical protein